MKLTLPSSVCGSDGVRSRQPEDRRKCWWRVVDNLQARNVAESYQISMRRPRVRAGLRAVNLPQGGNTDARQLRRAAAWLSP